MKLVCLFLLVSCASFAQSFPEKKEDKASSGEYMGVGGGQYFLKDWSDGVIRFSSGKVTDKFKLKFNTAQNKLLLQFNGSAFAAESKINEFVMYTKNKKDSFLFRKGYPITERGNEETFYQVLEEGKATLLQLSAKDIIEEKEILEAKVSRHYTDVELFYIFRDGKMHKVEKETTPVQDILLDRRDELKRYISEQQLKMRSAEDLVKVVKKYNDLQ